jgi:hypothetical protein
LLAASRFLLFLSHPTYRSDFATQELAPNDAEYENTDAAASSKEDEEELERSKAHAEEVVTPHDPQTPESSSADEEGQLQADDVGAFACSFLMLLC